MDSRTTFPGAGRESAEFSGRESVWRAGAAAGAGGEEGAADAGGAGAGDFSTGVVCSGAGVFAGDVAATFFAAAFFLVVFFAVVFFATVVVRLRVAFFFGASPEDSMDGSIGVSPDGGVEFFSDGGMRANL